MTTPNYYGVPPSPYSGFPPPVAKKPGSITTVAVFAIVMGSLGTLCCGVGGLLAASMFASVPFPDGTTIHRDPGVTAIGTIFGFIDLIASGVLLTCGIGALSLKPWARSLGVIISALIIVVALGRFVAGVGYTGEKDQVFFKELMDEAAEQQKKQGGNAAAPPPMANFGSAGTIVVGVLVVLIQSATPLMILLLWTKPRIKAVFAGQFPATIPTAGVYPPPPGSMPPPGTT